MCRSMVEIQSVAAEIRRGKKKKEEGRKKKDRNHRMKIYMVSLLHRATINQCLAEIQTDGQTNRQTDRIAMYQYRALCYVDAR